MCIRDSGGSCVKIRQSSFGVITALLRVRGLGFQRRECVEPCAALLQRVARGHILLDQCAAEMFGFAFGALPCLPRFRGGAAGVLRIAKIVCAELFAQRGFLGIE